MSSFSLRAFASRTFGSLLAAAAFGMIAASGPAAAQGAVKSVHSDWQVRCDTPPGGLPVSRGGVTPQEPPRLRTSAGAFRDECGGA